MLRANVRGDLIRRPPTFRKNVGAPALIGLPILLDRSSPPPAVRVCHNAEASKEGMTQNVPIRVSVMHLSYCKTSGCPGQGRYAAKDKDDVARLATKGTLRAYCAACDSLWPLSVGEQEAIAKNL